MTNFKVTDEAVEAAAQAISGRHLSNTGVPFPIAACRDDARAALEAALLVMFEQFGWWYETPHGRVVTKTMIGSGSNPLYRLKEPK